MSELYRRVLTALLLLLVVAGWYLYLPSPWFGWLQALVMLLAVDELLRLVRLPWGRVYLFTAAPVFLLVAAGGSPAWLLPLLLGWLGIFVGSSRITAADFSSFLAACWMAAWLLIFSWVIVVAHGIADHSRFIAAVCFGVWAADIAAYFVGRQWGKLKLCPHISPGKSVEGLAGGLVFGTLIMVSLLLYWQVMTWPWAILLALFAVMAGVLGDLAESALKRMLNVKDSGSILPGHGGILDRIDAIVIAVPVAYIVWGYL